MRLRGLFSVARSARPNTKRRSLCLSGTALLAMAASCSVYDPYLKQRSEATNGGRAGVNTQVAAGGADGAVAAGGTSGASSSGGTVSDGGLVHREDASSSSGGARGVEPDAQAPDSGAATRPWWTSTNEYGCATAGMPKVTDRPQLSAPGADLAPIYLALARLRWGTLKDDAALTPDDNAWQDVGFDMDGLCTNSRTCEVNDELVSDRACQNPAAIPYDGDECRDNEMGKLYVIGSKSPLNDLFGLTEADTDCEIHRGGTSVIFKVSHYNGELNDASVRLDLYPSMGLQTLPSWTCRKTVDSPLVEGWQNQGDWLSTQHWKIVQQGLDPAAPPPPGDELPNAKAADPEAYVRNGYLVAQMPVDAELYLATERTHISSFKFKMNRGTVVFQLAKQQDGTWGMQNGTVQFVARPNDLLQSYRDVGYCENMCGSYDLVKNYFNTHQDALTTSEVLPEAVCDGLSAAIQIRGRQTVASRADIEPEPPSPGECPQPANPEAPRQGCVCSLNGCFLPDSGS